MFFFGVEVGGGFLDKFNILLVNIFFMVESIGIFFVFFFFSGVFSRFLFFGGLLRFLGLFFDWAGFLFWFGDFGVRGDFDFDRGRSIFFFFDGICNDELEVDILFFGLVGVVKDLDRDLDFDILLFFCWGIFLLLLFGKIIIFFIVWDFFFFDVLVLLKFLVFVVFFDRFIGVVGLVFFLFFLKILLIEGLLWFVFLNFWGGVLVLGNFFFLVGVRFFVFVIDIFFILYWECMVFFGKVLFVNLKFNKYNLKLFSCKIIYIYLIYLIYVLYF